MTHEKAMTIARDYPTEMVAEWIFDAQETIDSLLAENKKLKTELAEARAYIEQVEASYSQMMRDVTRLEVEAKGT